MAWLDSGELVWETTGARTPRWVLLLDGPPGIPRRRVAPQESAEPQAASTSQFKGVHPQSVPRGHRPLARERDVGSGQVQAAVSVLRRHVQTNGVNI